MATGLGALEPAAAGGNGVLYAWADGLYFKAGLKGEKAALLVVIAACAGGHLGLWAALRTIWPEVAEQRCWNHRVLNVLDQVPQKEQAEARALVTAIGYAPTCAEAERRRDTQGRAVA